MVPTWGQIATPLQGTKAKRNWFERHIKLPAWVHSTTATLHITSIWKFPQSRFLKVTTHTLTWALTAKINSSANWVYEKICTHHCHSSPSALESCCSCSPCLDGVGFKAKPGSITHIDSSILDKPSACSDYLGRPKSNSPFQTIKLETCLFL